MPTNKPRISITLDAADLAVLDRYAAASGTPRASMLAALIKATVPELERAAELIELANDAPRKVVQDAVDNLANATADAMGFLEPFRGEFHAVMDSLEHRLQRELALDPPKKRKPSGGGERPRTRAPATRQGPDGGPKTPTY